MDEQTTPTQAITEPQFKRNTAYKLKIGEIALGVPKIEAERLKHIEIKGKQVVRANIIANIVDKYVQEGEKKFGSITLDDGTGQIKAKTFGDDVEKFTQFNQGDTVVLIGLVRSWNNEVYLTPEIIKKKELKIKEIKKTCYKCKTKFSYNDSDVESDRDGRYVKCPSCGAFIAV